jgi:tetratricopeptide (TPR) repeat protein
VTRAWLLLVVALAGCATPYVRGRAALGEGRYDEAAARFRDVLAADPARADARTGLGVALYKQGAFDGAADTLRDAVAAAPGSAEARLYFGLAHLRRGEDREAEAALTALRALTIHPRIAGQLDRAVRVLRLADLADDVRAFVAASLEDEVAWAAEVRDARQAPRAFMQPTWFFYWDTRDQYPSGWCP